MTTPTGLELVWADGGGSTDPGNAKYQLGWVAEIPTFQNFNYVLKALDEAKLSYAEKDIHTWNDSIAYVAGARVERLDKTYYCVTDHNQDPMGAPDPQDPDLDTTNSYWVSGTVFSAAADSFTNLIKEQGVYVDRVNSRPSKVLWQGNDITINNNNALVALNTTTPTDDNFLLGNVNGKIVVVNVGSKTVADGTTELLPSGTNKAYEVYHEGHKPTQAEVAGTIPSNPQDGKVYGRQSSNWIEISNSNNSNDYGLITGAVDDVNDYGGIA